MWSGIASLLSTIVVSTGMVCSLPVLAGAETDTQHPEGITPFPETSQPPSAREELGRQLTVIGEIELASRSGSDESVGTDLLALRTPMGRMLLETEPAGQGLHDHVGETFEVTGTVRRGELSGGAILSVESYRPVETTEDGVEGSRTRPNDPPDHDDGSISEPPF